MWKRERPWVPGNLFDLGRVDDGASGTSVRAPHFIGVADQHHEKQQPPNPTTATHLLRFALSQSNFPGK